ncbi:hypothetical protein STCU_08967 [Strigomonas culicis]|uniref:EGF-like domain-containing protein n=1 Tax=Strigomonas culicis TaxID=28005 RepID=S9TVB7_9TRYP|nr:hypothetical protein STCU_08967 [Strigomonas culicis]|eukprot:EPY20503.1 hypothetical protein STCU_08967 [Strigomonas culicis]
MAQTTVTNSTITITGYYPRLSTLMIAYTTATMQGTTPLYDFRNLVLQNHVVVYVLETTAVWNVDGAGGDVLVLGGRTPQQFKLYSGLYMVKTHATYAAHIVHQVLPMCTNTSYCLDIDHGLIAIDVATCVQCTGEFLRSEHTLRFFTGSNGGVVRISNCTSVGGQPFIYGAGASSFQFPNGGNIIFYGITVDSTFFSKGSALPSLSVYGYYSFMHINLVSMGNTKAFAMNDGAPDAIWTGNVTLGGTLMTSIAELTTNYITTFYFLDAYSKVTEITGSPGYKETVGSASSVLCVRPGFSSASWEVLDTWKRSSCTCRMSMYGPYCTQVVDPVSYYVNYNAANADVACSVPHCTTCKAMTSEQCTECDPGFNLSSITCVAKECTAAHCKTCVFDSEQDCSVCDAGYKLDNDNITCTAKVCGVAHCATCVFDTEDKCESCTSGYTTRGSVCVAASSSNGLLKSALIGIVLGAATFIVVIV